MYLLLFIQENTNLTGLYLIVNMSAGILTLYMLPMSLMALRDCLIDE